MFIDNFWHEVARVWSLRVAAFWSAIGALIVVLSAYLYTTFDWRVGVLVILMSVSFALARVLKQPGTEQ